MKQTNTDRTNLTLLVVLSALLSGCATYDRGRTDHFPEFSWDRLPLYIHIRKATAFTPEEIEYLATFPLITFEKFTGHATYGSNDAGTIASRPHRSRRRRSNAGPGRMTVAGCRIVSSHGRSVRSAGNRACRIA